MAAWKAALPPGDEAISRSTPIETSAASRITSRRRDAAALDCAPIASSSFFDLPEPRAAEESSL